MKFYKRVDLKNIKVLSFDLDNTLYDCQSVIDAAEIWFAKYLCQRYGLGLQYESLEFWQKVKQSCIFEKPNLKNDVTYSRIVSLVKAFELLKLPLKGGFEEATELVNIFIDKRSDGNVDKSVYNLLEKLRQKYPLISISNGNLNTDKLNLTEYFEYDLRPNLEGILCKPNSPIFEKAASLMHVRADQILHIGDDPYTDVYGAVLSHFKTVWYYKGYNGICPDERYLQALPDIQIDDIFELEPLLLD